MLDLTCVWLLLTIDENTIALKASNSIWLLSLSPQWNHWDRRVRTSHNFPRLIRMVLSMSWFTSERMVKPAIFCVGSNRPASELQNRLHLLKPPSSFSLETCHGRRSMLTSHFYCRRVVPCFSQAVTLQGSYARNSLCQVSSPFYFRNLSHEDP